MNAAVYRRGENGLSQGENDLSHHDAIYRGQQTA
jgi:hypothetical protein